MKWIWSFIHWLREGNLPQQEHQSKLINPMPEIEAVQEKAKEKVIITSKQMSDDIRETATPESILSDLRSLNSISAFTRIEGPTSDDILKELKKISDQIVQHRY